MSDIREKVAAPTTTTGEEGLTMEDDLGASQATGLAGAEAPEPPSRLGPTDGIPSAVPPFLAVFNGHVNDADKRARDHLARGPQGRRWLQEIERLEAEGKGIMYIFDHKHRRGRGKNWLPPVAVRRYVSLVTKFVNESRVRDTTPRRPEGAEGEA